MNNEAVRVDGKVPVYITLDVNDRGFCINEFKVTRVLIQEVNIILKRNQENTKTDISIVYSGIIDKPIKNGENFPRIAKSEGYIFRTQEELFESIKIK